MGRGPGFTVVVATDGSPQARAAIRAAAVFPWPAGVRLHGVVARRTRSTKGRPGHVKAAFDRAFTRLAARTRGILARSWSRGIDYVLLRENSEGLYPGREGNLSESKARGKPSKVTCVTKSNVLPRTDGLFQETAERVVRGAGLDFETSTSTTPPGGSCASPGRWTWCCA